VPSSLYVNVQNQNGIADHLDYQFCRWLTRDIGVAAIPLSPFYSSPDRLPGQYARFTFCKRDEVLEQGAQQLLKLSERIKGYRA